MHQNTTGVTGYVFWEAGARDIISADNPMIIGVWKGDKTLTVAVADPTQKQDKISFSINMPHLKLNKGNDGATLSTTSKGIKVEVDTKDSIGKTYELVFDIKI